MFGSGILSQKSLMYCSIVQRALELGGLQWNYPPGIVPLSAMPGCHSLEFASVAGFGLSATDSKR